MAAVVPVVDNIVSDHITLYQNEQTSFVAARSDRPLFPRYGVNVKRGDYLEIQGGFASAVNAEEFLRAPYGTYAEIDIAYSQQDGWNLADFGLAAKIDKKDANYKLSGQARVDVRMDTGMLLGVNTQIAREHIAFALFNSTVFSGYVTTLSGTDQFDDVNSNPVQRVRITHQAVRSQSGVQANALSIDILTVEALCEHPMLVEYYSRTRESFGRVGDIEGKAAFMAALWQVSVENVWISAAMYNSANPGQSESLGYIAPKHVLLFRYSATPQPRTPQSCLARYQYTGNPAVPNDEPREGDVRRWDDGSNPYIERMDQAWDEQFAVPRPKLGHLLLAPIS